jgi:hypothetical protein
MVQHRKAVTGQRQLGQRQHLWQRRQHQTSMLEQRQTGTAAAAGTAAAVRAAATAADFSTCAAAAADWAS